MTLPVRIAAGQLAALRRQRRSIPAGPLVGLLHDHPDSRQSVVLAAEPGSAFNEADAVAGLATVRAAFTEAAKTPQVELIDEASPGLADVLLAHGATVVVRLSVSAVTAADLVVPEPDEGVEVRVGTSQADHDAAIAVAEAAFSKELPRSPRPSTPEDGGRLLVLRSGMPVATAGWTPVGDGVAEIIAVATREEHRRRGLGALATAHATKAAIERGGARLPWLTTANADAARIYQKLGFETIGTGVILNG